MNYQASPSTCSTSSSASTSSSGGGSSSVRPLQIHLKNHCLLCLSPEDPSILQNIHLQNPRNLLNFQPLVYYLTAIDPTSPPDSSSSSKNYLPIFANLPSLCSSCYDLLSDLYQLHQQLVDIQIRLQKNINICRKIVRSSCKDDKPGGRLATSRRAQLLKQMGTGMRSQLSRREMDELRYFLENFQGLVVAAEDKFVFPNAVSSPASTSNLISLSYPVQFTSPVEEDKLRSPPPAPVSSVSVGGRSSTSSELIVVSGIDHNLKYEAEEADPLLEENEEFNADDHEEQEENPVHSVVVLKEDLDDETETDNQEESSHFVNEEDQEVISISSPESSSLSGESTSWKVVQQACDVCSLSLPLPDLTLHLRRHLGRNCWTCDRCHRVFLSRSRLIQHFTSDATGMICAETSPCFKHLVHFCTLCNLQFATELELHAHVFGVHELEPRLEPKWSCQICGWQGKTEQGLDFHFNSHLHRHQRKSESWHVFKALVPPPFLKVHQEFLGSDGTGKASGVKRKRSTSVANEINAGDFDFSCDMCGKKCCGSTALLRHVKEVHKGAPKRGTNTRTENEQGEKWKNV